MPRRQFRDDLLTASTGPLPAGISSIKKGDDDGTVQFEYNPTSVSQGSIQIQAMTTDVDSYPKDHSFFIFAVSDEVPRQIESVLESLSGSVDKKTISQLIELVASKLTFALANNGAAVIDLSSGSEAEDSSASEPDEEMEDEDSDPFLAVMLKSSNPSAARSSKLRSVLNKDLQSRLRSDLLAAKAAGLRIGTYKGPIYTISCRIQKLGISDEALQAWNLDKCHYLVLLLRFENRYLNADEILEEASSSRVSLHACTCTSYKPTWQQCLSAFAGNDIKESQGSTNLSHHNKEANVEVASLFISKPLNALLNERYSLIFRARMRRGFTWDGAEQYYSAIQGRENDSNLPEHFHFEEGPLKSSLPEIVTSDHIRDRDPKDPVSYPLATMQFVLRHVVNCTDFCLVCHRRMDASFEALKPYVCSLPLCLYQYMNLGFGPSIEYEILSQPKVVDVLLSFCYTSSAFQRLSDFPNGLALMVPHPDAIVNDELDSFLKNYPTSSRYAAQTTGYLPQNTSSGLPPPTMIKGEANISRKQVNLLDAPKQRILSVGQWIMLEVMNSPRKVYHARVTDDLSYPLISISVPVEVSFQQETSLVPTGSADNQSGAKGGPPEWTFQKVNIFKYDVLFDELDQSQKRRTICRLLCCLPSVTRMESYLRGQKSDQANLASWKDQISPAALGILRWIIASNRSCIMQVDVDKDRTAMVPQMIPNLPGALQFRFAMGNPDKEARFIGAIAEMKEKNNLIHPTLFAWHGSPLSNFHGILREGLNYSQILNGRAYGNGCYHSLDHITSMGYSASAMARASWPTNLMAIQSAICLNEIVNAPSQFQSRTPHLVVQFVDWIQTRYLLVYPNEAGSSQQRHPNPYAPYNGVRLPSSPSTDFQLAPENIYPQDSSMTPRDSAHRSLTIPLGAVSSSRRPKTVRTVRVGNKKMKVAVSSTSSDRKAIDLTISDDNDDDTQSVISSQSDKDVLYDRVEIDLTDDKAEESHKKPVALPPPTDWVKGTVDQKSLPILLDPTDSTSIATKTLGRDLKSLLKVQEVTPASELGWYVDDELINTLYQWIVELHSFDPSIPLAKDMKVRGVKSIVMELRFNSDYPMTPPFVRVIRPRFLSFMAGGGGHVTAGGAMCMELLTNDGWSSVSSIESVLMQVRLAMSSTDPKPARLEPGPVRDYSTGEAVDAYLRSCDAHGWKAPANFRKFALGGALKPQ